MGLLGHHLIRMSVHKHQHLDPRRSLWAGAGGAIGDPAERERRGTVRRGRRRFARLRSWIAALRH